MRENTPWLDAEQESLWRSWLTVHASLHAAIQKDLRTQSLSEPEFEVLVHLTDREDGGRRLSDLASGLQWERSRVSHLVTRMVKRGLVERQECADDGRGARIVVTADGRAAIERAAPGHVTTVRSGFFDKLDAADERDLARILDKLLD